MAKILGVGVATVDIISTLAHFPQEDEKLRADSLRMARGGNVTNTLSVLSKLGHDCAWAGCMADDDYSQLVKDDLNSAGISLQFVNSIPNSNTPVSNIMINQQNGSRTIVHFRDLVEFDFEQFKGIDISQFDHIHFEGREIPELVKMFDKVQGSKGRPSISLEVEKPREGIETLFNQSDLIMFSKDYAVYCGFNEGQEFLRSQTLDGHNRLRVCAWGKKGAYITDQSKQVDHVPAIKLTNTLETLAAGDVFNAALIDGFIKNRDRLELLEYACLLAGQKCSIKGLHLNENKTL